MIRISLILYNNQNNQNQMLATRSSQLFRQLVLKNMANYIKKTKVKKQQKQEQSLKKLTEQHIKKANNIKQLIMGANINGLSEQPLFRQFMRKITQIMNLQQTYDHQSVRCLQNLLFEIRRFSSAQIHSNASDLLNYQLFFKQLKQIFPKQYKHKGFEIRATMVAQNMPKIASYQGCQPVAQALLHYMSNISELSTVNLKRNLQVYFIDYFISNKLSQKVDNKNFRNGLKQGELIYNKNSQIQFDPNVCAILLSTINTRITKTYIQSLLDNVSIMNINKRIQAFKSFLKMEAALKIFAQKCKKSKKLDLTIEERKQIRSKFIEYLFEKQQISKILYDTEGKQILVVGLYEKYLQTVDIFINILHTDYKNANHNEMDYRASQQLSRFMYMVFLVSEDMKIWVAHESVQNKQQYIFDLKQAKDKQGNGKADQNNQQVELQQVTLWKVADYIVEGFSKNKIYNANKNNLLQLILWKSVEYFKNKIHLKQKNQDEQETKEQPKTNRKKIDKDLKQEIVSYQNSIINIISYMPIQILNAQCQKQPNTHKYLLQIIKVCVRQISSKQETRKSLIRNIINLSKLKNTLIIDKKQWVKIFSAIIKQDKNLEFWQLYFFIASTNVEAFIKLIPFPEIIKNLSQTRHHLNTTSNYIPPTDINESLQIDSTSLQQEENKIAKERSRKWQLQLLNLQAIILLANYEDQFPKLLSEHSNLYAIKLQEIQNVFDTWIEPFKFRLLLERKQIDIEKVAKETGFKFQNHAYKDKPIPFFQKYFAAIFANTEIYYQFKLIHKILTHPTVQNYLLYWQNYSKFNFIPYFTTLLLGLGNQSQRQQYLQKYPFQKIYPSDLTSVPIFSSGWQKISYQFYDKSQWNYFFQVLARTNLTIAAKELYINLLQYQQIYKNSSFKQKKQSSPPSKTKLSKEKPQQEIRVNQFAMSEFLNNDLKYAQLNAGYLYDETLFININKQMIAAIIQNLKRTVMSANDILQRFVFFVNYLHQLAFQSGRQIQQYMKELLEEKQTKQIQQIVYRCKLPDDKQSAILVHKLNQLGLLSIETAFHICKTVQFKVWASLLYIICLSIIGKQKAISNSLITEDSWKTLEGNIINVSSQIGYSFMWIYYSLKFSSPSRFISYINLLKRIYHPIDRKAYIKQLKLVKEKLNISHYTNLDQIDLLYKYEFQIVDKQNQTAQIQQFSQEMKNRFQSKKEGYFAYAKNYKKDKQKSQQVQQKYLKDYEIEPDLQIFDKNNEDVQQMIAPKQKAVGNEKKTKVGFFKKAKNIEK